jgi:hypothetical protein
MGEDIRLKSKAGEIGAVDEQTATARRCQCIGKDL